jgi:hypothetical protein
MGGTDVTLTGTDLDYVEAVRFGSTYASHRHAAGQLIADAPAVDLAGPVDVYVERHDMAPVFAGVFTYTPNPGDPPAPPWPIPAGRSRYVVTLHRRHFYSRPWHETQVAELSDARSRRLVKAWNTAAEFSFTIAGDSAQIALMQELATDVVVRRWDEQTGADVVVFRGVIDHSEDQLTEQSHTVNVVAHDYLAMMGRRYLTRPYVVSQVSQDEIVAFLVWWAANAEASDGTSFAPGSYLPLYAEFFNPDGSARASGDGTPAQTPRDRAYAPNTQLLQIVDDLAKVIAGFDYDVAPAEWWQTFDALRVFYPSQGVERPDVVLMYGATVATITRTVASDSYANYERVVGDNGQSDPQAPQLYAEAWLDDANDVTVTPVGLWQGTDNASDVNQQATLDEKAAGDLQTAGLLTPSYSLGLMPGFYAYGRPNMGDVCPLIIVAGRLNVSTTIRVLGIEYDIGDDGQEDVKLTVGRPALQLVDLFTKADRDVDALTRR